MLDELRADFFLGAVGDSVKPVAMITRQVHPREVNFFKLIGMQRQQFGQGLGLCERVRLGRVRRLQCEGSEVVSSANVVLAKSESVIHAKRINLFVARMMSAG